MPLKPGSDKATISQNISEFHTGKTYAHTAAKFGAKRAQAQAVAVALNTARKYADGGEVEDTNEWDTVPRSTEGRPQITVTKPQEYGLAPHISGILNSLKEWRNTPAPIKEEKQPELYQALDTSQAFPQMAGEAARHVYDSYKEYGNEFKKGDDDKYLADQPMVPNAEGKVPEIRKDYISPIMGGLDVGSNLIGIPGAAALKTAGMAALATKAAKPLSLTSQFMVLNKSHSLEKLVDTIASLGGGPAKASEIGVTSKQILKIQDFLEKQSPSEIADLLSKKNISAWDVTPWLPDEAAQQISAHQSADWTAKGLLYTKKNDAEAVAHDLFQLAEKDPGFANEVFKKLPDSIRDQVDNHLGQYAVASGRSPFDPINPNSGSIESEIEKFFSSQNMGTKDLEGFVKSIKENPKNEEWDDFVKNYSFDPTGAGFSHTAPGVVPFKAPGTAHEKGLNIPLAHGTIQPNDFDKFKLPSNEIGVHFGTPRAADERIRGISKDFFKESPDVSDDFLNKPRVFPVVIRADNPLRLPDLGTWKPNDIERGLVHGSGLPLHFSKKEVRIARYGGKSPGAVSDSEQISNLRKYIKSKGFDSIVYKNAVEDPGHDSYILFDTPEHDPHHVHGVKVPWAKFKDMNDPNLLTGLGGILAIPAVASALQGKDKMKRGGVPKKFAGGGAPAKSEFAPWDVDQGAHWRIKQQIPHVPHHGGMIKSSIPGRTDKIALSVPSGAFVLPADIPSALGQGNTMAGAQILGKMFKMGPYGSGATGAIKGGGSRSHGFNWMKGPSGPKVSNRPPSVAADGGEQTGNTDEVPIIAAGGEYIIHPDTVKEIGHGDMEAGHKVLNKFVLSVRKQHIATLRSLKPPKK